MDEFNGRLHAVATMNLADAWAWLTHVPGLGFVALVVSGFVCLFLVVGLWSLLFNRHPSA